LTSSFNTFKKGEWGGKEKEKMKKREKERKEKRINEFINY